MTLSQLKQSTKARDQERHHWRSDICTKHKNLVRFPHEERNGGQGQVGSRQGRAESSSSTGSGPGLGDKAGNGCAI